MKNYLRLFGAFFLMSFCILAKSDLANKSSDFDYSLNPEGNKLYFSHRYYHSFPIEVLDQDDRSIRFKNVQEDSLPLISLIVSALSFLGAILLPLYIDYRNRRKSIQDDFWARQVIYPDYVKPVMIFSSWARDIYFKKLDENFLDKWNSELSKQATLLNEFSNILECISSKNNGQSMIEAFGAFEDKASEYMNAVFAVEDDPQAEGEKKEGVITVDRKAAFLEMRKSLNDYNKSVISFLSSFQKT